MKNLHLRRAFTLIEVLVVIAIITTVGAISFRLFNQEALFRNTVNALRSYLQSVCDYANERGNCYLLLGGDKDGNFHELVLLEVVDAIAVIVDAYDYRLARNESIAARSDGPDGSQFQEITIPPLKELKGKWCGIVWNGPIRLVLQRHSSRKILRATFHITSNGTVSVAWE
jgi:prepilin-type N-terminal cleavage/methylation domain-containing protein